MKGQIQGQDSGLKSGDIIGVRACKRANNRVRIEDLKKSQNQGL